MKKFQLTFLLLVLACIASYAQSGTVQGVVTSVKPHFADTYALQVGDTELILTHSAKDKSGKAFEINKKFRDLVVAKDGQYILNPKYAGKKLSFDYSINGKGWKCIHTVRTTRK